MRFSMLVSIVLCWSPGVLSAQGQSVGSVELSVGGEAWLQTVIKPFDGRSRRTREETYKVFTHVYAPEQTFLLTKGAGGKYTHHRGLFIGWKDTLIGGTDFDTWHMTNCSQRHVKWLELKSGEETSLQRQRIDWCDQKGRPFIEEIRSIRVSRASGSVRLVDFVSMLKAKRRPVELKGDLQHAGMQIRLANEVSEHEETTAYILPEGAQILDDDKVTGAWWALCRAEIQGRQFWVVHMTPPDHPTGVPVYSIRPYGRFGAFFEARLEPGETQVYAFRIALSDHELTRKDVEKLYRDYTISRAEISP